MAYTPPSGGYIGDTYTGGPRGGGAPYNMTTTATNASGLPELRPQVVSNLSGALQGQLPQDVVDQIHSHAAEFGVASGMPGSEFAGYQGLRNLGLTSLDRMSHAEDLLTPGYHQSQQTTYSPPSPADAMAWTNHANSINFGGSGGMRNETPAYMAGGGGGSGHMAMPPGAPKAPDSHALIGDFLARYLPGSSGGGSPMGSNFGYNGSGGGGGGVPGADNWGDVPGFYAGSAGGFRGGSGFKNNMSNSDMVDAGLIDPLFDQPSNNPPSSFTGDINSDWGDEIYA